jgi:hypothetical protein
MRLALSICIVFMAAHANAHNEAGNTGSVSESSPAYASPTTSEYKFAPRDGVLADINRAFHQNYDALVEEVVEEVKRGKSPTIISLGSKLILYYQSERVEVSIIADLYHRLKAVGHTALGLYVGLLHFRKDGLSPQELQSLSKYRDLTARALESVTTQGFAPSLVATQEDILSRSLALLDTVISSQSIDSAVLDTYSRSLIPSISAGASGAAIDQIDRLHATMMDWRGRITDKDWAKVKVVISGAHQPRNSELVTQYFRLLFDEKGTEGALGENHIIFAEALFSEAKVIDLLARHTIDQTVAQSFFKNRFRLQKDLLADEAQKYLEKIMTK